MLKVYLISVLVITTNDIPSGWLQYTKGYSDQKTCEKYIKDNAANIIWQLQNYLNKDRLVAIKEMKCMTTKEAVDLNTTLGH